MKNFHLLIYTSLLFVFLFALQTNAQITLQVGGGLGYSVPTGDYGGSVSDFYNGTKYGMKSGINFHGKARVGILFLNAFGEVGYTTFSGDGDAISGGGTIKNSQKIVSMKVGPEFPISIPLSPITPYLQGFVSLNTFSGDVEFTGVSGVPSGKKDLTSATRVGLGGGIGVMFSLGGLKLDANIQYHLLNFAGKEYKIENVTSHTLLDNYTSLNDDKDALAGTTMDHFISNSRGISAMEFKLTVLFGL
ncbi:MAG: outer membrane beta-barrel protein [Ignavibacteriales bacterium]|nr:outer membrane beta-barrel protein [Ignavibacteriales bacterium]